VAWQQFLVRSTHHAMVQLGEFFQSMTLSMSNIIVHFCIGY
jgi:hypothetical protein